MNSFDNLYVPDPFSGSILKPQAIWMVDPYSWPNKRYIGEMGDTWTGDKWPFDDSTSAPPIPKVPYDFPDIPRKIREQAKQTKDLEAWNNLFRQPEKKTHKWENTVDGGSKFTLELAGTPKATVSVEINYDGRPNIVVKSKVPTVNIGGNWFIPSPERFDMEAVNLVMEDGLLEIFFPPKKVEKRVIKLL